MALVWWRPERGRWDLVWAHMLLVGFFIVGLTVGADVPASWTLITETAPNRLVSNVCFSCSFEMSSGSSCGASAAAGAGHAGRVVLRLRAGAGSGEGEPGQCLVTDDPVLAPTR